MKLDDLEYLREVVKHGAISIAAEKNFVSQSTLSTAINRLEKDLGVELFYRNNQGVIPTEFGKMVKNKADQIMELVQDIEQMVDSNPFGNSILLATSFAASEALIPYCAKKAREEQTPLKLSLNVMEDYLIYNHVASGFSKIGIGLFLPNLLTSDLKFTFLFEDELLVHIGPNSPLYDKEEITLIDILKQPYPAFGNEFLQEGADYLPKEYFPDIDALNYRSNSTTSIKRMVVEEDYICFLPAFNAKYDIYVTSGLLKTKRIKDLPLPIKYGYIENTRYKFGKGERYFLEKLKEVIEEMV